MVAHIFPTQPTSNGHVLKLKYLELSQGSAKQLIVLQLTAKHVNGVILSRHVAHRMEDILLDSKPPFKSMNF